MTEHKEYMVHIWGGAWNDNASPSIEADLGIKQGYHYFDTEEEKDGFLKLLSNPVYSKQGIATDVKYGVMKHKRTVFVGTFMYKDKEFTLHFDFGYEYPEDYARFQFLENNYSCDCNRSIFIREEYGEDAMPELGCGNKIELLEHHFEYWE